jgi:hypothetical protein
VRRPATLQDPRRLFRVDVDPQRLARALAPEEAMSSRP